MNENNAKEIIIIRPLRKADLPALEWEGEYLHFRRVFQDVYQRIEKGMVKCWVALTQDNQMIGQVFLQLVSDRKELADGWKRAYLYSLRVKPAWRNRGIGSKILSVLEDDLLRMNYFSLTLNVARDNEGAIRLYERLGFKIVGREDGVWSYPDHNGKWQTWMNLRGAWKRTYAKALIIEFVSTGKDVRPSGKSVARRPSEFFSKCNALFSLSKLSGMTSICTSRICA